MNVASPGASAIPLGAEVAWLCLPCYMDVTSRRALKKMPPRERLKAEQGRLWNE